MKGKRQENREKKYGSRSENGRVRRRVRRTEGEPDVNQNSLPNHEGPAINVVDTFIEIYKNKEKIECAYGKQCLFYPEIDDHSIEDCSEFKNEVQKLMDAKILLVGQMSMQEIENLGSITRTPKFEGDIDDVVDFEVSIYNLEQNIEENECDISLELLRLIEQEEKKTMSCQETLKVINLGTPEEVKEVR
ncbi:uncharacterized protein E6C27_scaffold93G001220 [Cucumis melo var. makuwa]|uniref:Gag-pol polyprotein n=1 Tax=Cucumis melo var. makuwa TaxID=1194695 RepID=A0A5A7TJN9_CUCMM|nr:uncharacterized protein E6C27_scaffold93G001220 [Cucumis melo var. makuwa]